MMEHLVGLDNSAKAARSRPSVWGIPFRRHEINVSQTRAGIDQNRRFFGSPKAEAKELLGRLPGAGPAAGAIFRSGRSRVSDPPGARITARSTTF